MTNRRIAERLRISVNGVVQGVGFRPFVFNLANSFKLCGFVTNDVNGVLIEAQGDADNLERFLKTLETNAPPLSKIIGIHSEQITLIETAAKFEIKKSIPGAGNQTLISPDVCICDDCLTELFEADNRRYLYPFINCTNCGPRYTIISGIPYDRPQTTMASFKMCPTCQAEYDDPYNRRFHAQPNACAKCGPKAWYESGDLAQKQFHDAFERVVVDLLNGKIVALKGLGGFHLAVDARNKHAVKRLRERKNREEKPLAIMVESLEDAEKIVRLDKSAKTIIKDVSRPIVLLDRLLKSPVAGNAAPGNRRLGVMLPYAPLHYVLFHMLRKKMSRDEFPILIMTSANLSEEPIAIDNAEARDRLSGVADSFLMHDRDILIRSDDSVVLPVRGKSYFFRRSRGYAPLPVFIKGDSVPVLSVGGELKNTICLLKNDRAFVSQHIGDLENLTASLFFEETNAHLQKILEVEPKTIVCDMHPGYFSTQWAKEQPGKNVVQVQHHHAHLAACMAENQLSEPVIGIILDGTGYGYDGKIWGGEVLIGNYTKIRRFAHLQYMPLPGGDAAIREPWRIAVGYLEYFWGDQFPALPHFDKFRVDLIRQMVQKNINCTLTSSCGRLFDAAAALAGGKSVIRYEGQAAIEMMQAVDNLEVPPFEYSADIPVIPIKPILSSILQALNKGEDFNIIAARFHRTLVALFTEIVHKAGAETGIKKVVLSGGVLQNEILLHGLIVSLKKAGFTALYHHQVPSNDGGISLGQAVIGRMLNQKELEKPEFENY